MSRTKAETWCCSQRCRSTCSSAPRLGLLALTAAAALTVTQSRYQSGRAYVMLTNTPGSSFCISLCQSLHLQSFVDNGLTALQGHATCVTEADKYAKGATKPGGYAAQGYFKDGTGATTAVVAQPAASASDPADTAFLSTRPPWKCSVCKVTCTSQETLLGHAAGVKHRRRVRTPLLCYLITSVVWLPVQLLLMNKHQDSQMRFKAQPANHQLDCYVSCH